MYAIHFVRLPKKVCQQRPDQSVPNELFYPGKFIPNANVIMYKLGHENCS